MGADGTVGAHFCFLPMKASIAPLLECPASLSISRCGGMLSPRPLDGLPLRTAPDDPDELLEAALRCGTCGREFPILSGVAVLTPDPDAYLRRYRDAVARDIGRHGDWSEGARNWFNQRTRKEKVQEDYGADFRYSQQFEDPWSVARAMVDEPDSTYGEFAAWLRAIQGQNPYDVLANWARERVTERRFLLDAGCGGGGLVARASAGYQAAFGVDLSFLAILLARRAVLHRPERERSYLLPVRRGVEVERPLSIPAAPNAEFVVGDCAAVPFPASLFDAVSSCNVIDIAGIERPLAEAARVLRTGGALVLADPFFWRDGEAPEGDPRAAVRQALEKCRLRVETERDGVPWAWATYDRHWRVYFSYCLAARK